MKYKNLFAICALLSSTNAIRLTSDSRDEVDELLDKQDQKDAQEVAQKEFNDANSKMNQIGNTSRMHSAAEDEDYMKSVFEQYQIAGKDKHGSPSGIDILTKDKAY